MANAFWGVTGFFIVLEVAFALAVLFSGGTKDDKQWVPPLVTIALGEKLISKRPFSTLRPVYRARTQVTANCRLRYLLTTLTVACCWLLYVPTPFLF